MINRVILVGRLTKDVEVKKVGNDTSMASFSIACNRKVAKGSQPQADFINCIAWKGTADFLGQYVKKGALLGIEGRIQVDSYEKDGKKMNTTKVVCDSVQLLESKKKENNENFGLGEVTVDITENDLPF